MKKTGRLLCLVTALLLILGAWASAPAERDPWDCPKCGRKGNTGNFCGSCGQPAPEKAQEPEAKDWAVLYKVYYKDESGTLLANETLTLTGSGVMTYTIPADEALIPAGYVLTGEDSRVVTIDRGRAEPSKVTFVCRPGSAAAEPEKQDVRKGAYVTFGRYEQDGNRANGKEAIEWLVLETDGNRALLLSRYVLDVQPYNSKYAQVTWDKCSLRGWLNGTFLYNAFNGEEQKAIQMTKVYNDAAQNCSGWADGGAATSDRVFLLSCAEAKNHLGAVQTTTSQEGVGSGNPKGMAAATAYAQSLGVQGGSYRTAEGKRACQWWLRSPGINRLRGAGVFPNGNLGVFQVDSDEVGVRPALWVDLESGLF